MFKHAIEKFLISIAIYYKIPILICISGFLVVTTSEVDTLASFTILMSCKIKDIYISHIKFYRLKLRANYIDISLIS